MKDLFHRTKRMVKKLQKMQEELKKNTEVQKFEMPDAVADSSFSNGVQVVEISQKSIAKAMFTILGITLLAYFVFQIKTLLILFFISLFFAAALDPAVDWLEGKKVPRAVGVILVFLFLLTIVIGVIGSMVPVIIQQVSSLVSFFAEGTVNFFAALEAGEGLTFLPDPYRGWVINTVTSANLETVAQQLIANFSDFSNQIKDFASGSLKTIGSTVEAGVTVAGSIAASLFNFILVLFLTFFMVVDTKGVSDFFHSLFPKRYGSYITEKTQAIRKQIGAWVRGQLALSLIMFVTTFVGLLIVGMGEYALTLALVMAIGEFIPYIGPVIFLAFALPVAFGLGLTVVAKLLVFYAILQFVEGNIFVPAVMNKAVGLSPIVVLLVLIIGWQFLGIIGAIIAVPVTTAIAIFVSDYTKSMAKKK